MFTPNGEMLWSRTFDLWGNKTVSLSKNSIAAELEKVTVWSFAGLLEVPQLSGEGIYWSQSRVYSSKIGEWLSFDPLFLMNPKALLSKRGNWNPTVYCDGDPVNFVDPSGYTASNHIEWAAQGYLWGTYLIFVCSFVLIFLDVKFKPNNLIYY